MDQSRRKARRQGFTLMEMLLVLGILVVLMGLVAPRVLNSQKKADVNAAKTQIGLFKGTLERYALDMRDFPTTEQGLTALAEKPEGMENNSNWGGPYTGSDEIPKDPWGQDYQYEYPPTHGKSKKFPNIWSLGPDREEGTSDDIVNWTKENEEQIKEEVLE